MTLRAMPASLSPERSSRPGEAGLRSTEAPRSSPRLLVCTSKQARGLHARSGLLTSGFRPAGIAAILFLISWLLLTGSAVASTYYGEPPAALLKLGPDIQQAVIVRQHADPIYKASLTAWERQRGQWVQVFGPMPAVIGRNGMAPLKEKREGDGRSPSGIYLLGTAFGYQPHIKTKLYYRQVTEKDHWVDDPESKQYNKWIIGPPEAASFENLKRADNLYKYAVVIEYNTSPVRRAEGSAIFMHVWRDPDKPTAGCVAVSEENIKRLLQWLDESLQPVIFLDRPARKQL